MARRLLVAEVGRARFGSACAMQGSIGQNASLGNCFMSCICVRVRRSCMEAMLCSNTSPSCCSWVLLWLTLCALQQTVLQAGNARWSRQSLWEKVAYPALGICPRGCRCIDPWECDHLLAMLQLVLCLTCAGCSPWSCSRGVACLIIKDEQLVLALIVPAHTPLSQMLHHGYERPQLNDAVECTAA